MKARLKTVLSIQSHVAYGHVGNAAAVFPLQRMGIEVIPVHTVQFSNHTGYGQWTGQVFDAEHLRDILRGIEARGALAQVDALLTGYLGSPAMAEVIKEVCDRLPPQAIWACDPVMGDVGRGFFVHADIPAFFRDHAVRQADIMTPNQFELEYLTGIKVDTLAHAHAACAQLHQRGVGIVLLTSLIHADTKPGTIEMLASVKGAAGQAAAVHHVATPLLPLNPPPNGAGDATAALFTGYRLQGMDVAAALQKTARAIFALFETTQQSGGRELALIAAQDSYV